MWRDPNLVGERNPLQPLYTGGNRYLDGAIAAVLPDGGSRSQADLPFFGGTDASDVTVAGRMPVRLVERADGMHLECDVPQDVVRSRVPERITAACADDVAAVGATACYSDGSTARKRVQWDTSTVDFSVPGEYPVILKET